MRKMLKYCYILEDTMLCLAANRATQLPENWRYI